MEPVTNAVGTNIDFIVQHGSRLRSGKRSLEFEAVGGNSLTWTPSLNPNWDFISAKSPSTSKVIYKVNNDYGKLKNDDSKFKQKNP